jgi:hypothetical protein
MRSAIEPECERPAVRDQRLAPRLAPRLLPDII